jgi:hypothetical protein
MSSQATSTIRSGNGIALPHPNGFVLWIEDPSDYCTRSVSGLNAEDRYGSNSASERRRPNVRIIP